jgi:hypothetical protein
VERRKPASRFVAFGRSEKVLSKILIPQPHRACKETILALLAQIRIEEKIVDQRGTVRRAVNLDVQATVGAGAHHARVHDLSRTGLLIETDARLAPGDTVEIALPHVELVNAQVVRARGRLFGCRFEQPIATAALSAALLRSPFETASTSEVIAEVRDFAAREDFVLNSPSVSDGASIAAMALLLIAIILFIYSLLALVI